MMRPARMAVTNPAAAEAPEATPNASASGNATAATVRPAKGSCWNLASEYPENSSLYRRARLLLGISCSPKQKESQRLGAPPRRPLCERRDFITKDLRSSEFLSKITQATQTNT